MDIRDFDLSREFTATQQELIFSKSPFDNPLLNMIKSESDYMTMCNMRISQIQGNTNDMHSSSHEEWKMESSTRTIAQFTTRTDYTDKTFKLQFQIYFSLRGDKVLFDMSSMIIMDNDTQSPPPPPLALSSKVKSVCKSVLYVGDWTSIAGPFHTHECTLHVFFKFIVWNLLKKPVSIAHFSSTYAKVPSTTSAFVKNVIMCVWGHPINSKYINGLSLSLTSTDCIDVLRDVRVCRKNNLNRCFRSFLLHTHDRVGAESPAHDNLCVDALDLIYKKLINYI